MTDRTLQDDGPLLDAIGEAGTVDEMLARAAKAEKAGVSRLLIATAVYLWTESESGLGGSTKEDESA